MKREGAILYPTEHRVRLRHDREGFVYELRERDDASGFDVVHIDTYIPEERPVGFVKRDGARLVAERTGRVIDDDALKLVARAWMRLPFLKPAHHPPATGTGE